MKKVLEDHVGWQPFTGNVAHCSSKKETHLMYQLGDTNYGIWWFWFELNTHILVFNTDMAQYQGKQKD